MSFVSKLNKKLKKMFDGQVAAYEDSGCLVLSGELLRWSDIVAAGKLAVEKNPYIGLLNDIECTGERRVSIRKPRVEDSALEWEEVDVLIIGGGITGCAIARELSKCKLSVLLVEKEHDLAMQASGRNNGVVQAGFDLKKGTQRWKYNRLGNPMFERICSELGVDFIRTGQYLCYARRIWEPFMFFSMIYWKWLGLKGVKLVKKDMLHQLEPAINQDIRSALFFPSAGVVNPFELTIAFAENAVQNGVNISFDTMVQEMVVDNGIIKSVKTNRGTIHPKVVVNAAGVFCDDIASMAGDRFYSIHPCKGTTAVLDKRHSNSLVQTIVSTLGIANQKKKHTKGGGVIRTIDGNVLVGPDSIEVINKEDFTTASPNITDLLSVHSRVCPNLDEQQVISYFSGTRAATYEDDFIICKGKYTTNIIHAAGIQSPGLTAAPAISIDVARMVVDLFGGESTVGVNNEFNPKRIAPPRLSGMEDSARSELIESNPDYGIIICRCEEISKGEILNALRRNVRCNTKDGVKRRVRSGMGRCQGGYCAPLILDIIAAEKRIAPHNIRKSGSGSEVLFGNAKTALSKRNNSPDYLRGGKFDNDLEKRLHAKARERFSPKGKDDETDGDEQI